jgi:hypothetical protein
MHHRLQNRLPCSCLVWQVSFSLFLRVFAFAFGFAVSAHLCSASIRTLAGLFVSPGAYRSPSSRGCCHLQSDRGGINLLLCLAGSDDFSQSPERGFSPMVRS